MGIGLKKEYIAVRKWLKVAGQNVQAYLLFKVHYVGFGAPILADYVGAWWKRKQRIAVIFFQSRGCF
jgi:hypothetical protein